jgi:hypothetical protein
MIKPKKIKNISHVPSHVGGSTGKKKIHQINPETANLPKYDFGTTMANIGTGFGVDKNKAWKDYSRSQKVGTIGSAGLSVAGSGMAMAGNIVRAYDKNPNRFDKSDATASVLEGVGSGVASGVAAGAMFGPIGGAIGGVVGGIAGLIGSTRANRAAKAAQRKEDTINSVTSAAEQASTVGMNNAYSNRKSKNLGIPGFDNGIYKFYSNKDNWPNAMVASGEVVVNPDGLADVVPGSYKEKDDTLASIENGSTILSKNKMFRLPYGSSTAADIGARASRIQSNANKALGLSNVTGIGRRTHELNLKNAAEVLDTVSIYAESKRNMKHKQSKNILPGYLTGTTDFNSDGSIMLGEVSSIAKRIVKKKNTIPPDMIKYPTGTGASKRMQQATSDEFIKTFKPEFDAELLKVGNDSTSAYSNLVSKYGAIKTGSYSRKLPTFLNGTDSFGDYEDEDTGYKKKPAKDAASKKAENSYYMDEKGVIYTHEQERKLKEKGIAVAEFNDSNPYVHAQKPSGSGSNPPDGSQDNVNKLAKAASIAMSVGNSLSQYANATPEPISAEQYTPNTYKYRSNLFNQLRDIQTKSAIDRYNNRVIGSNAGSASARNSSLSRNINSAFASAYDADNRSRIQVGDMNMRELARINNLNVAEKKDTKLKKMQIAAKAREIRNASIQNIAKTILPRQIQQTP